MDLRSLELLVAVADTGSVSAAATRMFCSQSSVSEAVIGLERAFSVQILDRSRRPARITTDGAYVVAQARDIMSRISRLRSTFTDRSKLAGALRVGTYASVTSEFLPGLLRSFASAYPEVELSLVELGGADLPAAAERGDIDCFFRQTTPPISSMTFGRIPLWREPFQIVAPPDSDLAESSGPIAREALDGRTLIVTGRYSMDGLLSHPFWASSPRPPRIGYEVTHPHSLAALVRAGYGVGVSTLLGLRSAAVNGLSIRDIDDPTAVRDVCLYYPRRMEGSALFDAFSEVTAEAPAPPGCVEHAGKSEQSRWSGSGSPTAASTPTASNSSADQREGPAPSEKS